MKLLLRLLITLCACLAACIEAPEGAGAPLESQELAAGSDGFHSQGTLLHGTQITGVSYSNATVLHGGTQRGAKLRLVKGELAADMTLAVQGTTPSLNSCFIQQSGPERSCGLVVEGQGTCTPRTLVTLTSGACASHAGSCMGKPVMRVCSGEAPCEHEGPGYIATGATSCLSACPSVTFACPYSGIYTVLSGAYSPGNIWSLSLAASAGTFPATTKEFRGRQLVGARLSGQPTGMTVIPLEVVDATNATNVVTSESSEVWDPSGDTWLYHVRRAGTATTPGPELCATGADAGTSWAWAVPVRGLYDTTGARQESSYAFTLGCDTGVISKCYRWGYKPWMDGVLPGRVTAAHWACTRMARADYCAIGESFTKDGTKIRLWDELTPAIIPAPDAGVPGMGFEAGWGTSGPACLSHWRWKSLPADDCVELNEPLYDNDGGILNDCLDPFQDYGAKCSQICDTPEEAKQYQGSRLFNESAVN